jgi:hypothetical protein
MPVIQQYDAGNVGLNPTEIGADAEAQAARRIGSLYHQEGENIGGSIGTLGQQAEKYMAHREISQGAAAFAGLQANLTDQWNETAKNADPNDPTVAKKFQAGLEDQFDKYLDSFSTEEGQRWAEAHIDNLREHLFTKTSADMSTLAGIAVKTNYEKTVNTLSSTAASDPSSLPFQLKTAESTISGMADSSPNLDTATAASVKSELLQKAKENIIKSAVSGMIQKNPNVDLDAIQKQYGEYINGAELKQFQKAAQVQAKANSLVDKQSQVAQRQLDELNVHKGATQVITDNVTFDPQTGRPIIDPKFFSQALDIAKKNPSAPNAATTVQTMFNWGESQQNKGEKPADDPVVKSDLMTRMFSADNPTTTLDLMKARAEGKISDPTFQAYHGLVTELEQSPIKGPVWDDTIGAVKGELILSNVGLPGKDIKGEGNYAQWAQSFIPQYLAMKRTNTPLPPNALNVNDPKSMISQSMEPFKRSVAQRAQDYLSVLGGGTSAPPPTVTTKEAFDALKSGTTYTGADGKTYRKP